MEYIGRKKGKKCIFCEIHRARKGRKNHILVRSKHCYAILNSFPYINGHTMIVANKHIAELSGLGDEEILDLNKSLIKTQKILKKILKPSGFNIGINTGKSGGAGVAGHLHIHLVPRWEGDTNFMSVISDTRVISQSLKEVTAAFSRELKKEGK